MIYLCRINLKINFSNQGTSNGIKNKKEKFNPICSRDYLVERKEIVSLIRFTSQKSQDKDTQENHLMSFISYVFQ